MMVAADSEELMGHYIYLYILYPYEFSTITTSKRIIYLYVHITKMLQIDVIKQ